MIIEGSDKIRMASLLALIGRVSIECTTGMRFKGRPSRTIAHDVYGIKSKTKRECLMKLRDFFEEKYGYRPEVGKWIDGPDMA